MTTKKPKSKPKRRPTPLKKFNVEFWGKAYVHGVLTVLATDEQAARAAAFAEYQGDGIYWNLGEQDEEYPVRIHDVSVV